MPCVSGPDPGESAPWSRGELDRLARMLCGLCGRISAIGRDDLLLPDPDLCQWWVAHQEMDRRRKAQEQREAMKRRLREDALAKLSPEEREALGV